MNRLPRWKRILILNLLVEGNSLRGTSRLADVSINTVTKLLVDLGRACEVYHNKFVRRLSCRNVQCDELWSFIYAKDNHLTREMRENPDIGSIWTWTTLCADTKLFINWHIGGRKNEDAQAFMLNLSRRLRFKVNISTDGYSPYLEAIALAFRDKVRYGRMVKQYDQRDRYLGALRGTAIGPELDPQTISTSFIERSNLTIRMHNRRYARQTNAHSKKIEHHRYALAIFFFYYNFCRIHATIRVTPAMEANVTDHAWSLDEMLGLLE